MKHKKLVGIIAAVGLAIIAGAVLYHTFATPAVPADLETWYRTADDVYLEPINPGTSYMYWGAVSAGIVDKIEPTPEEFVSDIRKTDILYYSDETDKLCRTYISWDADLEPGDHIVLDAVYKYRVDMDGPENGFEPTVLVDRRIVSFEIVKVDSSNQTSTDEA